MTGACEEPISFSATATLDDVTATNAHLNAAAARKRPKRFWRGPATFFIVFVLGIGAILASSDDPIQVVKVLLDTRFAIQILVVMAVISGMIFLSGRTLRRVNRYATRKMYADTRACHPAVDASDPALRMTRFYRFDETGMTTTTDFDEIWEAWPRITGLDETPGLLIVRVGSTVGYPLPKGQIPEELQERLHRFIAGRSHSKWPF